MPSGTKHLIQCHCILPQYRTSTNPIFHKFITFSIIDDSDTVIPKYAQCNNCGTIHKVYDICKSEIISGKDESRLVTTLDELKFSLPKEMVDVFESYDCDIPVYENAKFIIDNEAWGENLILFREINGDEIAGKLLMFKSHDNWQLETFSYTDLVDMK